MKVQIIPKQCIACGLCQTYSSVFGYHDDGIVKFTDSDSLEKVIPSTDVDTITAVKNCPTKALTIS